MRMLLLQVNLLKRHFHLKSTGRCGNQRINGILKPYGKGQGEKSALAEIKEKYGFDANAIVTMGEVVEYLYNKPYNGTIYIDDACKAAIDTYYEQYGAK